MRKEQLDNEVWVKCVENVLCRDFTKRQLKIVWNIMVLSFHVQKIECYIPTLSSFETIGVSRHKIKNELEKLEEANVINWNRNEMIFKINTEYDSWKVEFSTEYSPSKFKKLLDLNDSKIIGPS